jgi:ubiquinol-cytochrome c reductase cytochrome c1 subunit
MSRHLKSSYAVMALVLAIVTFPITGLAAGGSGGSEPFWEEANVRIDDRSSLHRGARLFVNYCMGCHSAQYHRWMHVANDLGLPDEVVQENFIWATDDLGQKVQVGELMEIAMAEEYGDDVFGGMPPDLTLASRVHDDDWIYNFLQTFYLDDNSPTGVNNAVLNAAAMPHVLWELQGLQTAVRNDDGDIVDFELVREGSMSPREYDRAVNDIVTFMSYLGEPAQLERRRMGIWVLLFLFVFTFMAWLLKREYWKDVH